MKLRTNKFIAVLCLVAMVASMIVPMFAITANAADTTATIKFDNKSKRTEYSTSKQVWEENGIVVTNDKDKSTSNVGDYYNPARFYKSSKVTIEAPGVITSLTIVGGGESKYKTPIKASLEGAGFSVTVSGDNYTIAPNATSITFSTTAQIRFASISVTYSTGDCDHANKTFVSETAATCVVDGAKVYNCPDCGETVNETVKAPGHNFVDNTCTVCGAVEYAAATVAEALAAAVDTKVVIENALVIFVAGTNLVTVKDLNGDAIMYVYQPTGTVKVGDVITIKGSVGTYGGVKQINKGATVTVTGTASDKVPAPVKVTIAEAKQLPEYTPACIVGTVDSIASNGAWSDQYKNMTVTIKDAEGNTITAYRLATKVAVGDVVAVTGTVASFNGNKQITEGCTALVANTTEVKAYGAQLLAGTTATSATTAVRLVLKLTSTQDVANIGAALEINAAVTADSSKKSTTTVYSSINADGYVVEAEEGSVFVLVQIYNIDNASFDDVIHVKPFMTVGDAELYGFEVTFSVNELIAATAAAN